MESDNVNRKNKMLFYIIILTPIILFTLSIIGLNILKDKSNEGSHPDPHIWMDPKLWNEVLSVIVIELIALSPEHEQVFTTRKNLYSEKLKQLDQNSEKALKTIPTDKRVLVTAHDAFHYFGLRYGFQVEGIQGISTESEAGVKDIERLVDILTQKKITAVFTESTVSEKNISALVDGVRNAGGEIKIGDSLYSDSMGNRGTYFGTYIGMIDHNISTITKFLGGSVPEGGIMAAEKMNLTKQ
jgi:manganese/zinc/iron transport system substrate-binding protein